MPKLAGVEKARIEKRLQADKGKRATGRSRSKRVKSDVVIDRIRFNSPADLRALLVNAESNSRDDHVHVVNGELVLEGHLPTVTYRRKFHSIKAVTIRGRILPPADKNFRVAVGRFLAIFNWEGNEENRFHDGGGATKSSTPPAFIPGKVQQVEIQQMAENVRVAVDGEEQILMRETLDGTITLMAFQGKIAIQEIIIEGVPDDVSKVAGPSHRLTR